MSTTITLNADRSAIIQRDYPEYNDHTSGAVNISTGAVALLAGFTLPKEYYHRLVEHVYARMYLKAEASGERLCSIQESWDEETVNWYTRPSYYSSCGPVIANHTTAPAYSPYVGLNFSGDKASSFITNGFIMVGPSVYWAHTSRGEYPPQLQIVFGDEYKYLSIQSTSPGAGAKVDRKKDLIISFSSAVLPTYGNYIYRLWYKQCKLYWRLSGSDSWNEIAQASSTGNESGQFIVPANTFPSGEIEYYIKTVDSSDYESTSDIVIIDTTDTLSSAVCVRPSGEVIDGNSSSVFRWQHVNQSGSAQTKADLQISQDGTTWDDLGNVIGANNTYNADPGRMTSGTWYWRVRTYNNDGIAGSWSEQAQFMVISSPSTPSVLITDPSPRPSIQWQTTEQEAFQLRIAGVIDQTYYGTDRQWHSPFYLPDGEYIVEVRTQSRYGMWSSWGSAAFIVQNIPGPEMALTEQSGNSVTLSWNGEYDFFLVYRDGIPIARTSDRSYVDDLSIGNVSYQIRGCYSGNNYYGLSPVVTTYVCPEYPIIKLLGDADWLELQYSTEQHQVFKTELRRDIQSIYMSGRKYPVSEASEFFSYSLNFNCAFPADARPSDLEAMVGQIVCVKTPNADMAIGALKSLPKRTSLFYIEYSISVSNEQHEEEIDIDTGFVL